MQTLQHYGRSLALLTDLYQLTMAYGYWRQERSEQEAVFQLTFRRCPFGGQYAIACGLQTAADFLQQLRFVDDDLQYLQSLNGADGKPLFAREFLDYLGQLQFGCDVDAVQEGTAVFAHEPLLRVRGPLLQAQIIETAMLTIINFQTLVATKAARVCQAAQGRTVLEFGLRRAQGIDGGLAASRAAFVGGCHATSNVLAGRLYDIPVKGTHAHSWVMSFEDELESFEAYARAMPNNSLFLVDTYDTLEGVRKAVQVGRQLRRDGHQMLGIRLDSGDLAELSRKSRQILDEGGFPDAVIVASSDLDEYAIEELLREDAKIGVWGVGTRLATAYDQPALGGVYKLAAIRDPGQPWRGVLKLSEQPIKVSNPGIQQVRRFGDQTFAGDVIYNELDCADPVREAVPLQGGPRRRYGEQPWQDLLKPVFRGGQRAHNGESASQSRQRAADQLAALPEDVKRLADATPYPVGLEPAMHDLKQRLMQEARDSQ